MADNGSAASSDAGGGDGSISVATGLSAYKKGVDAAYAQAVKSPPTDGNTNLIWTSLNPLTTGSLVLAFGLVISAMASRKMGGSSAGQVLRLFGTIMAITMACFLIVSGVDDHEIASGIGFLGTIVGYLLGRPTQSATPDPEAGGANQKAGDGADALKTSEAAKAQTAQVQTPQKTTGI